MELEDVVSLLECEVKSESPAKTDSLGFSVVSRNGTWVLKVYLIAHFSSQATWFCSFEQPLKVRGGKGPSRRLFAMQRATGGNLTSHRFISIY